MLMQGYGTWNSNMSMETGWKDIKNRRLRAQDNP
jgi:hypothetical protein